MNNEITLTHGSLFSGIGGFDLAASWLGFKNIFQVEIDKYCLKTLNKNFPNATIYEDKGLGNAIVPQIAYKLFSAIKQQIIYGEYE